MKEQNPQKAEAKQKLPLRRETLLPMSEDASGMLELVVGGCSNSIDSVVGVLHDGPKTGNESAI